MPLFENALCMCCVSVAHTGMGTNMSSTSRNPCRKQKTTVRQACEQLPCNCQKLLQRHPGPMQSDQDHVVIRTEEQWIKPLHPLEVSCIAQNPRNTTLPDDEFVEQCIARLLDACAPSTHTKNSDLLQADSITRTIISKCSAHFGVSVVQPICFFLH